MRVRWRGDHQEVHPELGLLTPGRLAPLAVSAERAAELAGDPTGWFEAVSDADAAREDAAAAPAAGEEG